MKNALVCFQLSKILTFGVQKIIVCLPVKRTQTWNGDSMLVPNRDPFISLATNVFVKNTMLHSNPKYPSN